MTSLITPVATVTPLRALDMKYRFDIKMRELLKSLNHPFNTNEINRLLNEAQLRLVKEYARYFDRNEDVRKLLSVLVKQFVATTFDTDYTHPNGMHVVLPPQVLNVVSETVNNSTTIKIKPMSHDEYIVNINNPFKKPDANTVWRIDRMDAQELITDGTVVINSYECDYIIMPPSIDIDNNIACVLQDQVHEEIIDEAIRIALSIINRSLQTNKPN